MPWDKEYLLQCPECDWQMLWGEYLKTFQGKHLRGHNFEPEFKHFLQHFPKARTPAEKMILIDRLIHAVHTGTAKPAAVNLLSGNAQKLALFLDDLAYGDGSTEGIKQSKAEWESKLRASRHFRNILEDDNGSD